MEFFRKVQQKIKDGALRDMAREGKWMWAHIRRYRGTVVTHLVLMVASIAMGLATSVASKFLIDAVTGHSAGRIASAAAWMAGMLVGSILLRSFSSRISARINIRVKNELQAQVYRQILETDWQSVEKYRGGDLLQRLMGDVATVSDGVTGFVPELIGSAVQFLGALAIMLWFDPTMALIALVGIPLAALCSRLLVGRMREHSKKMKAMSSDMTAFCQDSLENLTSIKAFDITGLFYHRMTDLQGRYREEYLDYNRFSVRTSAFLSLVGILVSGGCFGWGVYRLWAGAITFGSMTMFLQLSGTLSGAFSALIRMVSSAISISTSAGRVMELGQLPTEAADHREDLHRARNPGLRLEDVSFTYESGEAVLSHVDLEARAGDLVALTGPSGEGKTTLLRLLLGLVRPQGGRASVLAEGETIPISAATRSAFAYVPQGNSIFAGTVAENLRLTCPDATDAQLEAALDAACALDFVQALPDGLNHLLGSRGKGLSEGQAQRLAIARALLCGAPILLLDEATSALDQATEARLLHNLMHHPQVQTCIFATHRPGTMDLCTRQYHVEEGRVRLERGEAQP